MTYINIGNNGINLFHDNVLFEEYMLVKMRNQLPITVFFKRAIQQKSPCILKRYVVQHVSLTSSDIVI